MIVADETDVPAVRAIQDQFVVDPLEDWGIGVHTPLVDFAHPEPVPNFTSSPDGTWLHDADRPGRP